MFHTHTHLHTHIHTQVREIALTASTPEGARQPNGGYFRNRCPGPRIETDALIETILRFWSKNGFGKILGAVALCSVTSCQFLSQNTNTLNLRYDTMF